MILKRRNILLVALVLVVASALYINHRLGENDDNLMVVSQGDGRNLGQAQLVSGGDEQNQDVQILVNSSAGSSYFAEARVTREQTRAESLEIMEAIVNNNQNPDDVRREAASDIAAIARAIECEGRIENLILAKGFTECLAVMSGDSVTVVVKTSGLKASEIAQIKDVAVEQSGMKASQIKIVEIK